MHENLFKSKKQYFCEEEYVASNCLYWDTCVPVLKCFQKGKYICKSNLKAKGLSTLAKPRFS